MDFASSPNIVESRSRRRADRRNFRPREKGAQHALRLRKAAADIAGQTERRRNDLFGFGVRFHAAYPLNPEPYNRLWAVVKQASVLSLRFFTTADLAQDPVGVLGPHELGRGLIVRPEELLLPSNTWDITLAYGALRLGNIRSKADRQKIP